MGCGFWHLQETQSYSELLVPLFLTVFLPCLLQWLLSVRCRNCTVYMPAGTGLNKSALDGWGFLWWSLFVAKEISLTRVKTSPVDLRTNTQNVARVCAALVKWWLRRLCNMYWADVCACVCVGIHIHTHETMITEKKQWTWKKGNTQGNIRWKGEEREGENDVIIIKKLKLILYSLLAVASNLSYFRNGFLRIWTPFSFWLPCLCLWGTPSVAFYMQFLPPLFSMSRKLHFLISSFVS